MCVKEEAEKLTSVCVTQHLIVIWIKWQYYAIFVHMCYFNKFPAKVNNQN